MLDWTQCSAVEQIPNKVSGAWLFKGTRVPVKALFDNLEDGASVEQFVACFPGVTREQVPEIQLLPFTGTKYKRPLDVGADGVALGKQVD